jgi:hypothetical protein
VRHVRMLGLCLVAALALGAYAVSSASALEWGKCELAGPGHNYTGPNCTKAEKAKPKGTGEYEWRKASEVAEKRVAEGKTANVPFSGGSGEGGGVLTTTLRECETGKEGTEKYIRVTRQACQEIEKAEGIEKGERNPVSEPLTVECANETDSGEAEGKNKVANVQVLFTTCAALGVLPCHSGSLEEGEVKTSALKGKLGWINKANKEVGVLLEPAQHHGLFAQFECAGFLETYVGVGNKKEGAEFAQGVKYPAGCVGTVEEGCEATPEEEKHGGYDQIISPITPVNQMTTEFTQVYTEEAAYPFRNLPTSFENKHASSLEDYLIALAEGDSSMWSSAGEVISVGNTPEEAGEIKA